MKIFWVSYFGKTIIAMTALDLVATIGLVFNGYSDWLSGIWVSAVWFFANALVTWRIAEWVRSGKMLSRRQVFIWSMLKFPVLYLVGFWVMMLPSVRTDGVLVTFSVFLIGIVVTRFFSVRQKIMRF